MKNFLVLITTLLLINGAFAQDIIVKKDGDIIRAKVLELDETNVLYKDYSNPEGPSYSLKIDNILSITYENGKKETFSNTIKQTPSQTNNDDVSITILQSQIANLEAKAKTIHTVGGISTLITSLGALAGFVIATDGNSSIGNILLGTGIILGIDFLGISLTNAIARPAEEEANNLRDKMNSLTSELSFQPSLLIYKYTNTIGIGVSACYSF